ncbi:MAG: Crp/Fnr family transcriptional regulator [Phycisphaerae bacterium]
MNHSDAHHLSEVALFEGMSEVAVSELESLGRELSFEAGHTLFERGGAAEDIMILRTGVVELLFPVQITGVTREVTMESKRAGDLLAWSAMISPYCFTLSARCASDCTITGFGRDALNGFFETDPKTGYLFMRNLAGVIGRRLQAMQTMWVRELQASVAKHLE